MSRCFLPPVNRAMTTLDRSFFQKTLPITAAHVFDPRNVSRVQRECSEDVLTGRLMLKPVTTEEDATGKRRKLVRMMPNVKHDDLSTASEKTREFVHSRILELVPHNLHIKYENWRYNDIVEAILPEELLQEYPTTFNRVGHIVHLNLRNQYLPYKHILAAIILDKDPGIKTVVNKIQDVGSWSDYRTFPMELLAGSSDTKVEVSRSGCCFHFDFAKVYWNSSLENEHNRMVNLFKPGEAVADVMAGVGPFSIPAAKKKVVVWANDLNPDSYASLKENIWRNKVKRIVQPFNLDAREFIRTSIPSLLTLSRSVSIQRNSITVPRQKLPPAVKARLRRLGKTELEISPPPGYIRLPPTFSHFIMNLAASATSYLDAFIGAYNGLEHIYFNSDNTLIREFPMIHVYVMHKSADSTVAAEEICEEISKNLGHEIMPVDLEHLENVRNIAPGKSIYCASFRLPPEVMFADLPLPRTGNSEMLMRRENWMRWIQD